MAMVKLLHVNTQGFTAESSTTDSTTLGAITLTAATAIEAAGKTANIGRITLDGVAGVAISATGQSGMIGQISIPGTGAISLDAGGKRVSNAGNPTVASDLVTKGYADSLLAGFIVKTPARVSTTAALGSGVTYSVVNQQLSGVPNIVDGITLLAGDRVLVLHGKTGDTPLLLRNGIYRVVTVGTGSNGVWQRTDDFNGKSEAGEPPDVATGASVSVNEGTAGKGSVWVLVTLAPVVDTTVLEFTKYQGQGGQITAGAPTMEQVGNEFRVKGLPPLFTVNNIPTTASVTAANLNTLVGGGLTALHGHPLASTSTPGYMSSLHYTKLEGIAVGADVSPITSISNVPTAPVTGTTSYGLFKDVSSRVARFKKLAVVDNNGLILQDDTTNDLVRIVLNPSDIYLPSENVSGLDTIVDNKLDKVDTLPQTVNSQVTFRGGLVLSDGESLRLFQGASEGTTVAHGYINTTEVTTASVAGGGVLRAPTTSTAPTGGTAGNLVVDSTNNKFYIRGNTGYVEIGGDASTITGVANVGTGPGKIFKDITSKTLNLRSLVAQNANIKVTLAGDNIAIEAVTDPDTPPTKTHATTSFAGTIGALARADHVHAHGTFGPSGAHHAIVTTSLPGFMGSDHLNLLNSLELGARAVLYDKYFQSGGAINSGRAVCVNSAGRIVYASSDGPDVTSFPIGVATTDAIGAGTFVSVIAYGMNGDFTGLTAGSRIYLGPNGTITHTVPTTAGHHIVEMGVAISATEAIIAPRYITKRA